jgi:hypothetical protein
MLGFWRRIDAESEGRIEIERRRIDAGVKCGDFVLKTGVVGDKIGNWGLLGSIEG